MLQRWLLKGKKIFGILRRLSGPTKSEHPARRSESVPRKQSDARINSPFFKIAFVFKRRDHVVSLIVNSNDSIQMIGCETSRIRWRHSGRCTTDVQACVFASIARKTRIDSPPVTVNNPMRTSARLTNPKVMAVVKTAPKSAAEELNRLIAQKASTKIPIAIRVQPIPMRRAEKNDSAGNRGFFMCWTFWPYRYPTGNPKRFWRELGGFGQFTP